ncbi:MAG: antibiotic biosynthesis monooxygenase family protein [Anaerolineales bacterium]|jgi:quinol monooxygenase YgiN
MDLERLFTAGLWTVRQGKASEFIALWKAFAEWSMEQGLGHGDAYLLQDQANPHRFLSFSGWDSPDRIEAWRSRPEFQTFSAKARDLCEAFEPMTMETTAKVRADRG